MGKNPDNMPQTGKEVAAVMAEARMIFGNLREYHSKALLLCLSSELRKWEYTESFERSEEELRTCLLCGGKRPDVLDAEDVV
jgi:hypothetical protein